MALKPKISFVEFNTTRHTIAGSTPLLTPEEEIELSKKIARGDSAARERMILANLRLVMTIAREIPRRGLDMDDIIAEGNIGLMIAVDRFRGGHGAKFSTYAAYWIRRHMLNYINQHCRVIRLPSHVTEKIRKSRKILKESDRLPDGNRPTMAEVAKSVGTSEGRLNLYLQLDNHEVSIDAPSDYSDGDEINLLGVIDDKNAKKPDAAIQDAELHQSLIDALHCIPRRERDSVMRWYGINGCRKVTLEKIAKTEGVTRERIRQLRVKAVKRLRRILKSRGITGAHG